MIAARQIFLGRGGGAKLPYDAEVEYLRGDGASWINTGLVVPNGYSVETKFRYNNSVSASQTVVGSQLGGSNLDYQISLIGAYCLCRYGTSDNQFYQTVDTVGTYKIDSDRNLYINGVFQKQLGYGNPSNYPLYIMALNKQNSALQIASSSFDIYYVKIGDSSGVLLDLIPVRIGTEGAMYDRVSKQIFRNQGTGAFLYGRDINPISARSYVNDGLIAMWDGIENAGWGKHEDNPDKFVDLVNGIAFSKYQTSAYSAFTSNALRGATYFSEPLPAVQGIFAGAFTVEDCVTRVATTGTQQGGTNLGINNWFQLGAIASGRTFIRYRGPGVKHIYLPSSVPYTYMRSCAVGEAGGALDLSFNGEFLSEVQPGDMTSYNSGYMYLGTGLSQINFETVFPVLTHCIRFYNRALTAEEIAANYAVDRARFNLPTAS